MNIQNISFIPVKNSVLNQKPARKVAVKNSYSDMPVLDSLSFLGNYNAPIIKKSIDIPIADDEEFQEVMQRVYNAKTQNGNTCWIPENYREIFSEYTNATDIEMGLLPYCGASDASDIINIYLSGKLDDEDVQRGYKWLLPETKDSCIDVVRALDYSLKHLDDEFGTYQGLVFRSGYMDGGNGQFYSTTKDPAIILHGNRDIADFDPTYGFHVIRIKNGHKIYKFQEKMGSKFAEKEGEVLRDRKAKSKKVAPENLDEELLAGKEELAKYLFKGADKIMSGEINTPYTREQLLSFIDVYEEI